jgi:hypothetical protein
MTTFAEFRAWSRRNPAKVPLWRTALSAFLMALAVDAHDTGWWLQRAARRLDPVPWGPDEPRR